MQSIYFTELTHLHLPCMWLAENKKIAEEPTFHELIDYKQGCPTRVRRANTLLSNKIELEMEPRASINRVNPRKLP